MIALVCATTAQATELAKPPYDARTAQANWTQTVAQTRAGDTITLLTETCGWPGGAMRAQWVRPDRTLVWGCWGYNETGVQIQWSGRPQTWISFADLHYWHRNRSWHVDYTQMGQRLLFLRNTQ